MFSSFAVASRMQLADALSNARSNGAMTGRSPYRLGAVRVPCAQYANSAKDGLTFIMRIAGLISLPCRTTILGGNVLRRLLARSNVKRVAAA